VWWDVKKKHEYVSAKIKGKAKEDNIDRWNGMLGPHRSRRIKAWRKRVKKPSVEMIQDTYGGNDIEVSELDDDSQSERELLDGSEKGESFGREILKESQV
jgi:hypothetical protein